MVKHLITVSDFLSKKKKKKTKNKKHHISIYITVEGILKGIQSNNNLPNILLFKFTFSEILSCDKNT